MPILGWVGFVSRLFKRQYGFVILALLLILATGNLYAQLPPDRVRLTTVAAGNLLEWQDGGSDGATTFFRYEIGRATSRGGPYTVIGDSGAAFSYIDTTAAPGVTYYYAVRDVNSGGATAWSDEVIRYYPVSGATIQANIYKNENVVKARWPIYENEIVKSFVGLSTVPGEANITGFIDVGHATEYTFTGLSLVEGQSYYVTVKIQSTSGYLYDYGVVYSSMPFIFEMSRDTTDHTADNYFNNARARVMTAISPNSVGTINFANNVLRRYRAAVTLIERGIESRFNAPVEITLAGTGMPTTLAAARNEFRVADEWGNEVPCQVTAAGNQLITEDIYNAGAESVAFVEGFSAGTGTAQKLAGSLRLTATSNGAVRTWVTDDPIDLTGWDEIEINWRNNGNNNNNNRSFFVVSTNKDGTFDADVDAQIARLRTFTVTETLNVSGINGPRYLRVHANRNGANSAIDVYRITLRKQVTQTNLVLIANLPRGESRNYWVYWGGGTAAPANFLSSSNDTSQRAWSQYYSRKLLPPGIESDPISSWTKLPVTVGDWYDRGGTWVTLPWAFPYFSRAGRATWFLAIKGTLTGVDFRDYQNTWAKFIANAANRDMISALWLDTSIRDTDPQPQNIGYYSIHKDSGQPDERFGFFWRANRYGMLDDIYMFQTFLYRYGDIAHRYEYLTYAGLWVQGTWDNPLNLVHNTVGISHNNNADYFWSTPLREGIGQTPTSFFQYRNAVDYLFNPGNIEDAGAGGIAGHFDSHIFDSRAATPNWQTMEYEVTANGGRFHFLIRSGPTPEPDGSWTSWNQIATNVNANGSVAIPGANNHRFIQYRCVFLKAAAGNNPLLNRVNFISRGLEILETTATTPDGVSQGQDGIPVTVKLRNFHTAPVQIDALSLTFDLGSYTQTLDSHVLPVSIPAGADLDLTFLVDVWNDSPTGFATIHASVEGSSGALNFSDDDADTPHQWLVKTKSDLFIRQIDATPPTVNKGQTVLVRMLIENHGETTMQFDAASLTFSLGAYNQTVTAPPVGTLVPAGGSMVATFSVTVLPSSPSGVAIIDGIARGINVLSGKIASDTSAEITDSWIIQNPAQLELHEVIAPEIVYRGQTNVPVKLVVNNVGEAEARWDRSFLLPYFTLGTYDLVDPVTVFPLGIFGGLSATGDYSVSISPLTATGISAVDAMIEGIDRNTGFAVTDEYANFPASWTIIQEFVKTYSDSALLFESDSFNRPESGTITIYARSEDLAPFHEYSVRWLNPSGVQVLSTNPPITSDDNGMISHQISIDSTAEFGNWIVRITNPLNTHTACENTFSIVTPASLSVDIAMPPTVSVGQQFDVFSTLINSGGADIIDAFHGALAESGTGAGTRMSGPLPATLNVDSLGQATSTYVYRADVAGTLTLTGNASGYDGNSNQLTTSADSVSRLVFPDSARGLWGYYYSNINFTGVVRGRIDPEISFDWGAGAPFAAMPVDNFSVRWMGYVIPEYSETYTFFTRTDDGARLWVDGQQLVNQWVDQGPTEVSGTIVLQAGVPVPIIMEYYERGGGAVAELRWQSPSTPKAFIPAARMRPGGNATLIQSEPNLSVVNINEVYTTVYRNQQNLTVTMTIRNDGMADAMVEAASLTFSLGDHTQQLDPLTVLPFILAGESQTTLTFTVGVAYDSPVGNVNISGSFRAYDTNRPSVYYGPSGGAGAWTISAIAAICSANSSYNPEQYAFNIGQTVYARFAGLPLNQNFRIRFYTDSPTGGVRVKTSPPLNSGAFGVCDDLWTLLDVAGPFRRWRVSIDNGTAATEGTIFAYQYFDVQTPGSLDAVLTLEPDEVFIGETITATLSVTNPDATASTIASVTACDIIPTAASTGQLSMVASMTPASATLVAQQTVPFSWTFEATDDTGLVGSYSMTAALANSARGYDANIQTEVLSAKALSNSIFIYRRAIEIASSSLVFPDMVPGEASDPLVFEVINSGNYPLDNVKWAIADLKSEFNDYISKASLKFEPDPIASVGAGTSVIAQAFITVPFNQPAGNYIATMSVYEDLNADSNRDFFEPYDLFAVQIRIPSAKSIILSDDLIDLGNWAPGQTTTAQILEIFSSGNLDLDRVKLQQTVGSATFIAVDPAVHGPMLVGQKRYSDVYAAIPGAAVAGTYLATWVAYDDVNNNGIVDLGEVQTEFQVRIGIGAQTFDIAPLVLDLGLATPTYVIENIAFDITNTGILSLNKLQALPGVLDNGIGDLIASDNIAISLPVEVTSGVTEQGFVSFYAPAGMPVGNFTGTQTIFEDANQNGVLDPGEPSATFDITVEIVPYRAVQVIPSTVDLGDISAGTGGTAVFWCRNIGNMPLIQMRWDKPDLLSATDLIPAASYNFPTVADEPFAVAPGEIFPRQVQITVPGGTDDGNYLGNAGWLFEDMNIDASRQPGEPQDGFLIALRVGNHSLDILEASVANSGGPFALSGSAVFNVRNTGTLTVSNPKATATALIFGAQTIPAANNQFTPAPMSLLVPGQTRAVNWRVDVPASLLPGVYTGSVTVWNDSNNDGVINPGEAFTTAALEFEVTSTRVIEVVPEILDLNWATEGETKTGVIAITNQGNIALTNLRGLTANITNAASDNISNISFIPNPIGPLDPENSVSVTVSVTAGTPQSTGLYSGIQRVYDDYRLPAGSYTVDEESDTFELRMSIGVKQISVTPNVVFPNADHGQWVNTPGFTASNISPIPLTALKWHVQDMSDGTNTIPAANIRYRPPIPPNTFFSINSFLSNNACVGSLTVPLHTPPGVYTGVHTIWEDDNNNGAIDPGEASATFNAQITVNPTHAIALDSATIDLGTVQAGNGSLEYSVGITNTGNTVLSGIVLSFVALHDGGGNFIDPSYLKYSGMPASLLPGTSAVIQVSLDTIPEAQAAGLYTSLGHTLSASGGAMDQCQIMVQIDAASGGPDFGADFVHQMVNPTRFNDLAAAEPNRRYILSAWVNPGSGSADIGFATTDAALSTNRHVTISVDHNGALTEDDLMINVLASGISMSVPHSTIPHPDFPGAFQPRWYRIYVVFEFAFDSDVEDHVHIFLRNSSPSGYSVWFDGIQLEEAAFDDQLTPTTYSERPKIISPSRRRDLRGQSMYYEW